MLEDIICEVICTTANTYVYVREIKGSNKEFWGFKVKLSKD